MSNGFELGQDALERWLSDWTRAELGALRGRSPTGLPFDAPLEGSPFFLDSLELLTLASRAADSFGVRDAGVEDYFLARRTLDDWAELIRTSWRKSSSPAVSFLTSGSTGTPTAHRHELAWLREEIEVFHAQLPTFATLRKSVPSHHIYGFLFTVLLPDLRGCPVVAVEPEAPVSEPNDLVVTHPVHLGLWKQRGLTLPAGLSVVTSTSALPDEVWDWLTDQGCRVNEVFGSSETAGLGVRSSRHEPFRLLPYWSFTQGEDGTSFVRPGRPSPLLVPDHLEFVTPTQFYPRGRRDRGVKIAGRLVYLETVRRVLLAHPDVVDCSLRTEPTAAGLRVAAFVVPRAETGDLDTELRRWAAEHLETGARPHRYTFGPRLPQKIPGGIPVDGA